MTDRNNTPQQQLLVSRVVCLAILCSVLALVGIAYVMLGSEQQPSLAGLPLAVAAPIATAFAVMSLSLPHIMRRALATTPNGVLISRIVGAAMAEAVALIGFMRAVTSGSAAEILPFAGASLLLLIIQLVKMD
jgi:hypothetical protein